MDKLIVFSDLHLGPPPGVETDYNFYAGGAVLVQAIGSYSRPGHHLVFNGDSFDLLMFEEPLDLATAAERMDRVLDGAQTKAFVKALGRALNAGAKVTIRPGNHDLELHLPEVQETIRQRLGKVGAKLRFDCQETMVVDLHGERIAIAHGDADDLFNRYLPKSVRALEDKAYPPGSELVAHGINPAKEAGLSFVDVLKPDVGGALMAVLLLHPRKLGRAQTRKIASFVTRACRRRLGNAYALAPTPIADEFPGLDRLDEKDLHALLGAFDPASKAFHLGRFGEPAKRRILRALLAPAATLHRMAAEALDDERLPPINAGGADASEVLQLLPSEREWSWAWDCARAEGARILVGGHTHFARLVRFDGQVYANSGTWAGLMRLPPYEEKGEWKRFAQALKEDPGVTKAAREWLNLRLTCVELRGEGDGIDTRLVEWTEGGREELRSERPPEPAQLVDSLGERGMPQPDKDIEPRVDRLEEELESWWERYAEKRRKAFIAPGHLEALTRMVEELLRRARGPGSTLEKLERLSRAETIWQIARQCDQARRDPALGECLQWADAVAHDAYAAGKRAAEKGRVPLGQEERLEMPLVVLEPGVSPATYGRGARPVAPTFRGQYDIELPFPIILLPPDYLAQPGLLATILHEVGHDLDFDFSLSSSMIKEGLFSVLPVARRDAWTRWLPEVLADLIALRLGGPGYIDALAEIALNLQGIRHGWEAAGSADQQHPPVALRLQILRRAPCHIAPAPGWAWAAEVEAVLAEERARAYADEIDSFLAAISGGPAGATDLGRLLDAVKAADWRSQPCRLQREITEGRTPRHLAVARFGELARSHRLPDWHLSDRDRKFLQGRVNRQIPTYLERPDSLYKLPPLPLLKSFDNVVFIGSTHGQLLPRMEQAFLERRRKKWQNVVLFFHTDAALQRMAVGERTPQVLKNEKKVALGALLEQLDVCCERWAIFEYDQTSLFASVWWREEGEQPTRTVWHVHTSARVWGQDIRRSPSTDFRSVTGDLSRDPEVRVVLEGIQHLMQGETKHRSKEKPCIPTV